MSDGIDLIIGSAVYGGWKSAVVQTGLEQSFGRFSLHVASRWSEKVERRRIYAGDAFSLRIEGETVMQGFV
ncbi:phage baseplate assembly protein, partial [Acinetobacter baumannii]